MLIKKLSKTSDIVDLFRSIRQLPYSFWLDSARDPDSQGRYSFMGCDPFLVFKAKGNQVELITAKTHQNVTANPFKLLKELMQKYRLPKQKSSLPFNGGAVGYFGYDLGRQLERLPSIARNDQDIYDAYLCFYDVILAVDNLKGQRYLISTGLPETESDLRNKRRTARLKQMEKLLNTTSGSLDYREKDAQPITSHFTEKTYCQAVQKAVDYISAGDIFVINLSQRLSSELTMPPFALYRSLREINPAPFASYLEFPEIIIAGASPERFLKVTDGVVQTRPIKGTRPRGRTKAEDDAMRRKLWNSSKDRAELTMIVDLERNDLGKVCRFGTVKVPEIFKLEEYATVFHLVSTVEGRLRTDKTAVDLLMAAFPGGSITGAPKIRAMEIIDELEPVRRGIYTGSIGYLDFNGDADLNIVIRSFVIHQNQVYFSVGGGITIDSDPVFEYRETWDKAKALVAALNKSGQKLPITGTKF